MTLVVTAVASDAVVMGTDSAVSLQLPNAPSELVYTGLKKLFLWSPPGLGVSVYGTFPTHVEGQTFSNWLQRWYSKGIGDNLVEIGTVAELLCDDLNGKIPSAYDNPVGMHLAGWADMERYPNTKMPFLVEVSRDNNMYSFTSKLGTDFLDMVYRSRTQNDSYAFAFFAAGWPNLGKDQLLAIRNLLSTVVRQPVPAPKLEFVHEYVSLLVSLAAKAMLAAALPAYVAEPVATLLLTPEPVRGVGFRR